MTVVNGGAVAGGHIGRINDIFDAKWYAVKRTAYGALVKGSGLGQDEIRVAMLPGLHCGLALVNAVEAGSRYGLTRDLTSAGGTDDFGRGELVQGLGE